MNIVGRQSCQNCKFKKMFAGPPPDKQFETVCARKAPHCQIFPLQMNGRVAFQTHSCHPPLPPAQWCGEWSPEFAS